MTGTGTRAPSTTAHTGRLHPSDGVHFRNVLSHFCSGLTVVTTATDNGPVGFTCQSFTSLSLSPPLVAVCPSAASTTWPRIRATGSFCVNVLSHGQEALSDSFARSGTDKFRDVAWSPAESGAPVLDGALAWIDCRFEAEHEAGDHTIVVGAVTALWAAQEGSPLLFFKGGYGRVADAPWV